MEAFRAARKALSTIPGVSTLVADVIIAETGGDMSVFPTAAHLASWAGVCPGSNESAGRVKSTRIMPGNKYLKGALGIAAMSASRGKNTYLSVKYKRIALRRGRVKAIVAIEHVILTATWHMLANGEVYTDPGADFYLKREPEQAKTRAIRQL
jgi:transposase